MYYFLVTQVGSVSQSGQRLNMVASVPRMFLARAGEAIVLSQVTQVIKKNSSGVCVCECVRVCGVRACVGNCCRY